MAFQNIRAMLNRGVPYEQASYLASLQITAADAGGTYTAAEQTLVNETKDNFNALVS